MLTQMSNPDAMEAFEHRVELSVHEPCPPPISVTLTVPSVHGGPRSVSLPLEPDRELTDRWYSPPVIIAVPTVAAHLTRQSGRRRYTSWGTILIRCPPGDRWHEPPGMLHAEAHVSGRVVETWTHLLNPGIELVPPKTPATVTPGGRPKDRAITLRLRFPFNGRERLVVDDGLASSQDAVDLTGSASPMIGDSRLLTIEELQPGPLRLCIAIRRVAAGRHGIITTLGRELACSGVETTLDVP